MNYCNGNVIKQSSFCHKIQNAWLSLFIYAYCSMKQEGLLKFQFNDGGRSQSKFRGRTGDCVVRSIAIATNQDYETVYKRCAEINQKCGYPKSCRKGVFVKSVYFKTYMQELGFRYVSTMQFGSRKRIHLRADELPEGKIICNVSKHSVAVINHKLLDTYDCSRGGTRMVYGYWIK